MAKAGYTVTTSTPVSLAANTAKTALMVITPAQFGGDLKKYRISFDGTTASAIPVLVELVTSTNASNATPGTNNTSESANIAQVYGRSIPAGFTAFSAATAEPTVLTAFERFKLTPTGGTLIYDFPLGDTPDWAVSAGIGIRLTAPAAVNVTCSMWFERC